MSHNRLAVMPQVPPFQNMTSRSEDMAWANAAAAENASRGKQLYTHMPILQKILPKFSNIAVDARYGAVAGVTPISSHS